MLSRGHLFLLVMCSKKDAMENNNTGEGPRISQDHEIDLLSYLIVFLIAFLRRVMVFLVTEICGRGRLVRMLVVARLYDCRNDGSGRFLSELQRE